MQVNAVWRTWWADEHHSQHASEVSAQRNLQSINATLLVPASAIGVGWWCDIDVIICHTPPATVPIFTLNVSSATTKHTCDDADEGLIMVNYSHLLFNSLSGLIANALPLVSTEDNAAFDWGVHPDSTAGFRYQFRPVLFTEMFNSRHD